MTRFGIVGTGRISDWILKGAVQDPRFIASAVCSRNIGRAREFIGKHPEAFSADAKAYEDIEEMVRDSMVDAIYIGTPNSTHLAYTLKALDAGKHVLCEKPLGCSAEEVEKMVAAGRKSGKVLMEAMISTLNPNFRAARERIAEIMPVRHCSFVFCQYSSKYEALKKGVVASSFNPRMGGGALADVGVYTTFPLLALFGEPSEVSSHLLYEDTAYGKVDVQGSACMRFDTGMTASISFSKAADSLSPTEICGEGGNIILDAVHICREVKFAPHGAPSSGRGKGATAEVISSGLDKDEYFYEFEEFINLIESGAAESDINSLELSLTNARVMDKIKNQ